MLRSRIAISDVLLLPHKMYVVNGVCVCGGGGGGGPPKLILTWIILIR